MFALVVRVFNTKNGIETDSIAASGTYHYRVAYTIIVKTDELNKLCVISVAPLLSVSVSQPFVKQVICSNKDCFQWLFDLTAIRSHPFLNS